MAITSTRTARAASFIIDEVEFFTNEIVNLESEVERLEDLLKNKEEENIDLLNQIAELQSRLDDQD